MILIRPPLTYSPLLICYVLGDQRKTHYVSDHEYIKMRSLRVFTNPVPISMKNSLVTFSYSINRQFHWPVHSFTRMWPVMRFPLDFLRFPTIQHINKGVHVREKKTFYNADNKWLTSATLKTSIFSKAYEVSMNPKICS